MSKIMINTIAFQAALKDNPSQFAQLQNFNRPLNGFEVRGELFDPTTETQELELLKAYATNQQVNFFFSIPEQLFIKGKLNPQLAHYFELAEKFNINSLKISLGEVADVTAKQVEILNQLIDRTHTHLTVENEPNENGSLDQMAKTLNQLKQLGSKTGYTFDSGNWYWIDEDPLAALTKLQDYVTVFHLKNIESQTTLPLSQGTDMWRQLVSKLPTEIPIILEYTADNSTLNNDLRLLHEAHS